MSGEAVPTRISLRRRANSNFRSSVEVRGGVAELRRLLSAAEGCRNLVVFSGSGLSAPAGMSTFSTKGGLYERAARRFGLQDGKRLFSYSFFEKHRLQALAFFADIYLEAVAAAPAAGHRALAGMAAAGCLRRHYTLNIDGLGEAVGMDTWHPDTNPNGVTVEMHGSVRQLVCPSCGHVVPLAAAALEHLKAGRPVACSRCNHTPIRIRVMLYDDAEDDVITPETVFDAMEADMAVADMVVWVGISFQQSASTHYFRRVRGLVAEAGRLGEVRQVVINPSDEAVWNLLSASSNTEELEVLEVLLTADAALPPLAAQLAAGTSYAACLAAEADSAAADIATAAAAVTSASTLRRGSRGDRSASQRALRTLAVSSALSKEVAEVGASSRGASTAHLQDCGSRMAPFRAATTARRAARPTSAPMVLQPLTPGPLTSVQDAAPPTVYRNAGVPIQGKAGGSPLQGGYADSTSVAKGTPLRRSARTANAARAALEHSTKRLRVRHSTIADKDATADTATHAPQHLLPDAAGASGGAPPQSAGLDSLTPHSLVRASVASHSIDPDISATRTLGPSRLAPESVFSVDGVFFGQRVRHAVGAPMPSTASAEAQAALSHSVIEQPSDHITHVPLAAPPSDARQWSDHVTAMAAAREAVSGAQPSAQDHEDALQSSAAQPPPYTHPEAAHSNQVSPAANLEPSDTHGMFDSIRVPGQCGTNNAAAAAAAAAKTEPADLPPAAQLEASALRAWSKQ